jgi:type IV pilus assembly protein PilB
MQTITPPRLGDILVSMGVVAPEQLQEALQVQSSTHQRLGTVLMSNGWATEEEITKARGVQMDVPYVMLGREHPDPLIISLIPYETAQRCALLPLSLEIRESDGTERLRVAMVDPWDVEAIDLVQRESRKRVEPLLASEGALLIALERFYRDAQGSAHSAAFNDSIEQAGLEHVETTDLDKMGDDVDVSGLQGDQAPVIRFVNTLFADAIRHRASDIHIEPRKRDFQIRYRVDGQMVVARAVPRQFLPAVTSRIKIMGEMDISEKRLPLDGRIALRLEGKSVDMRVSTLPTQYGERVVMRILDRSTSGLDMDQLGFSSSNRAAFNQLIHKPHGIILVTGPTGSGKTTTLYSALNALKSPSTNILTCEDPIEYELEGVSQSNVNERAGLTFAKQLRAILRQDPDVVLVGEIRDAETAEIAFRAALTGHLVLSTLHCNEAAGAASRLLDMGVAPFLIASTLIGVVAQRLVRKLCPTCRREVVPDVDSLALFRQMGATIPPVLRLHEPVGCPQCHQAGTKGRIAVHELMVVNSEVQRLTMQQATTEEIRKAALKAGMIPMITDGLEKVSQGLTSLDDVIRKIGMPTED